MIICSIASCNFIITALCLLMIGTYQILYTSSNQNLKVTVASAGYLVLVHLQTVIVTYLVKKSTLEQIRQHNQTIEQKNDFKAILKSMPEGILIARPRSQIEK